MKKTEKEVLLTGSQLEDLGDDICRVVDVIELQNRLYDHVAPLRGITDDKISMRYDSLYKSASAMFAVNQKLMETLNDVAHVLFNATDPEELKGEIP